MSAITPKGMAWVSSKAHSYYHYFLYLMITQMINTLDSLALTAFADLIEAMKLRVMSQELQKAWDEACSRGPACSRYPLLKLSVTDPI